MMNEGRARQVLDRALAHAKKHKGADASVSLRADQRGNTRIAQNEITSSADVARQTLSVTVQFGLRSASATTNQLDDASVEDVVARTVRMAKLAPENPETMPPLGKQTYVKAKASDGPTAKLAASDRAKAAGAALAAGSDKLAIAGYYEHALTQVSRATSAGLSAHFESTRAEFSCTARTADGTGSGWASASSNRAADFDPAALVKIAADKAAASAKPKKLDPGRYTVVLEPAAVSGLLSFLMRSLGARRADEGRSYFAKPGGGTRVGDKLFPELISLVSDPADAATGGAPFDVDGLALAKTTWLDKGVLKGLIYNRYWAKKQGRSPTGDPSGWTLGSGKATREELVKGVKRGVLVTRFWYLRDLDPQAILVTGLTRDGTFLIENGEIAGPVNNFRFNDSPVQMLAKCDALGTPWIADDTRTPTLRTHEFNLASISEAV